MKKLFFLASALAVLAACGNNDELPTPAPEQEAVSIDLRSMNYEGVMTLLSEQTSLKDVTLIDGATTRSVSELVASDNVDPNQMEALIFNSANAEDSVDLTVTPAYVSVRMTTDGKQMAYMTFADANQQNEIISLYEEIVPATRSGEPVVTRGVDNGSFSLNLTEVAQAMTTKAEAEGSYVLPEKELKYQESAATRGWFSNLWNKIVSAFKPTPPPAPVRKATIDIYLMREKGSNPLTHEMNWQVNDAISSLKDVHSDVNFNVYIRDCAYKGSNDVYDTLNGFTSWVKNSSYKNTNGVFFLCRWGGWSNLIMGAAWINDYNVNDKNPQSTGISCTTAWYSYTLAHEMGHNFGAEHISKKWYEWFNVDLMTTTDNGWFGVSRGNKHKNSANRDRIKSRLKLN